MKLKELIEKISLQRKEDFPFPDNLDRYLEDFVPNTLLKSETLAKAFGVSNREMEELYKEAYDFYSKDLFEDASTIFRWLVILNPFTDKYWLGLGSCLMLESKFEKALHQFAMAALLNSENPYPHFHAYQCYSAMNNNKDAEKALALAHERTTNQETFSELKKTIEELLLCPSA